MFGAIISGLSGLYSNLLKQRASGSNIANINTPGYRAVRADALAPGTGSDSPNVSLSQRTGAFLATNEPLDLAIEGNGFFKVMDDDANAAYMQTGRFHVDSEGYLATSEGLRVSPPVKVGGDIGEIHVDPDGSLTGMNIQTGQTEKLGRLQLCQFPNPAGLSPLGGSKYAQSAESGNPTWGAPGTGGLGTIRSGGLSMSNVDLTTEIVKQTLAERGVEANVKSIRTSDEMLGTILDMTE